MLTERLFRFALLSVISAVILTAQSGNGTVQGVVKDVSSAVVAGAQVTIVNTETMVTSSPTTNEAR
jgi:hypothetical protein